MKSVNEEKRCLFWPKCNKGEVCPFAHPKKNCTNFPNCWFGNRCLFIHPPCRFDRSCAKPNCPFTHYGNGGPKKRSSDASNAPKAKRVSEKSVDALAEMLASFSLEKEVSVSVVSEKKEKEKKEKKKVEKKVEKQKEKAAIPILQKDIPCRFAGNCRYATCRFKHPKECRYGGNCYNPSCQFYHKPVVIADRYKWTAH